MAVSNSLANPVTIYANAESAVPKEVHEHLDSALIGGVNDVNRNNKRAKFCFETSEDALHSWVSILQLALGWMWTLSWRTVSEGSL